LAEHKKVPRRRANAADLRLLDDLGWDPEERRESYALTLPTAELAEALGRLRRDAEDGLEEPEEVRRGHDEGAALIEYFSRARQVCGELIERLDTGRNASRP
jgi:hypothetical protein